MDISAIQVLLIEDSPGDARLIQEMLSPQKGVPFEVEIEVRLSAGLERLEQGGIDVILLDLALPDSQGLSTFNIVHRQYSDLPIIVLTGFDYEAPATMAVRQGAQDYLVKGRVDEDLLRRSIRYAIERKQVEREREQLIAQLQEALARVKTLSGMLPICASCHKVRDDKGYWQQIEVYIRERSEADFSHGICPVCARKLYPELFDEEPSPSGTEGQ